MLLIIANPRYPVAMNSNGTLKQSGTGAEHPMKYTLGEAAKACGKSKPTLSRALKRGDLTAPKNSKGEYEIDPSELSRVFPLLPHVTSVTAKAEQSVPPPETGALEREIVLLREMLEEMKSDRDEWRGQAQKITALIEDKRSQSGFFARLFGK